MNSQKPPATGERLLLWCLRHNPSASCIVGDLRQEYAELMQVIGRFRACVWYWTQVFGVGRRYAGAGRGQAGPRPKVGGSFVLAAMDWAMEIRLAVRSLRKVPDLALAVILTLALGIGANATMFGVVDRVLLSPPEHVRDYESLRVLYLSGLGQRSVNSPTAYSFPDYTVVRDLPVLAGAALYRPSRRATMGSGPDAARAVVQDVTASFFSLLGVTPERGRFFDATDDTPTSPLTAVISHEFWDRKFGGAPDAVGRGVQLGSSTYQIIGVAPHGFTGAELQAVDVWVPVEANVSQQNGWRVLESRGAWWFRVIVRLADGVSDYEADAVMSAAHSAGIAAYIENGGEHYGDSMGGRVNGGSIITGLGPNATTSSTITLWLASVSLLVLAIACANVANLLLARGIQLRKDRAVRLAFGASRARLIRQSLTEALVLTTLGGLAALLVSGWASQTIYGVLLPGVPVPGDGQDLRLVGFLVLVVMVTSVLSGLIPAFQVLRTAPGDVLRRSRRGSTDASSRVRGLLTMGQVMLSVVLLVGAGLFVKSLSNAADADLGFDYERMIVIEFEREAGVGGDRRDDLYREALPLALSVPGVENAVLSSSTRPLYGYDEQHDMRASRIGTIPRVANGGPYTYSGTEGFIETVGFRLLAGRAFEPTDYAAGAPMALMVSRSFADGVWPGLDPLKECVFLEHGAIELEGPEPCRPVIGVYDDIAVRSLADESYSVTWPTPAETDGLQGILVRSVGDPVELVRPLRERLNALSSDIRYVHVTPIAGRVERMLGPWRVGAIVFSAFGVLALFLASLGLYSVLAFSVTRRRREIGIRAALGARRADLIRMVVMQAGRFVVGGLVLGSGAALAGGRLMDAVLFGVPHTDVSVFVMVGISLLAAGLVASWVPALKATAVDPVEAIQAD